MPLTTISKNELIELGKSWLEYAPAQPTGDNPDLLGFSGNAGFVCKRCAGRILARGCNIKMLANIPVWIDQQPPDTSCCLCS